MKKFLLLVLFATLACGGLWGEAQEVNVEGFTNPPIESCGVSFNGRWGSIGRHITSDGKNILYQIFQDGIAKLAWWDGQTNHIVFEDLVYSATPEWIESDRFYFTTTCDDPDSDFSQTFLYYFEYGRIEEVARSSGKLTDVYEINGSLLYWERLFLSNYTDKSTDILWQKYPGRDPEVLIGVGNRFPYGFNAALVVAEIDEIHHLYAVDEKLQLFHRTSNQPTYTTENNRYIFWFENEQPALDTRANSESANRPEKDTRWHSAYRYDKDSQSVETIPLIETKRETKQELYRLMASEKYLAWMHISGQRSQSINITILDTLKSHTLYKIDTASPYEGLIMDGWSDGNLFFHHIIFEDFPGVSDYVVTEKHFYWNGEEVQGFDLDNPRDGLTIPLDLSVRIDNSGPIPNLYAWDGKNMNCVSCEFTNHLTPPAKDKAE